MPRSASRRIVIVGFAGMQSLDVVGPFDVFSGADQVVDGATGALRVGARAGDRTVAWTRRGDRHAALGRRVATVCTGAFLAAQAGLLDGRRVTTHWARADRLQQEFPTVKVDPDPIYLRDGDVWTSAGVTAGIDLALALVEDDHGVDVAQTVARAGW